jgi:hypothetical protein
MPPHLMEGPEGFLVGPLFFHPPPFQRAVGVSRMVDFPTRGTRTTLCSFPSLGDGRLGIELSDLTYSTTLFRDHSSFAIATLLDPRKCVYIWHSNVCIAQVCS